MSRPRRPQPSGRRLRRRPAAPRSFAPSGGARRLGTLLLLAPGAALAQSTGPGPAAIPVDRWLVSPAFAADTVADPLARDFLAGAEPEVLPERGRESGSTSWLLLRRDSAALLSLDSVLGERPARAVAYAHAYIRSPTDRSLRLEARGPACGAFALRLNGQPLEDAPRAGSSLRARLGAGWNTLLVEALGGECPFELGAALLPGPDGLEGVRVRASRPPGEARSFPAPWVELPPELEVEPPLAWRGEALWGTLSLPLAAWGPGVVDSVRLRLRLGAADERLVATGLQPARVSPLPVPLPVRDLRRGALERPGVRLEVRWGRHKTEPAAGVSAGALLLALHQPIRLEGWGGVGDAGPAAGGDPPLPGPGSSRGGSWRVPPELAGFTLLLDPDGAPASYRIGSGEAVETSAPIRLCGPCRAGETITVHAAPAARWERYPSARIAEGGFPTAAPDAGAPTPETWLRALGQDGNAEYLRLSGRHGRPAEEPSPR